MTSIFIAATGNDMGQTFVTASLIRHLRQMGNQVDAVNPIVCGYDPAKAAASNPGILLSSLGLPLLPEQIDRISPWRFRRTWRHDARDAASTSIAFWIIAKVHSPTVAKSC